MDKKLQIAKYDLNSKSRITIFGEGALMPLERKKQMMATAGGTMAAMGAAGGAAGCTIGRASRTGRPLPVSVLGGDSSGGAGDERHKLPEVHRGADQPHRAVARDVARAAGAEAGDLVVVGAVGAADAEVTAGK